MADDPMVEIYYYLVLLPYLDYIQGADIVAPACFLYSPAQSVCGSESDLDPFIIVGHSHSIRRGYDAQFSKQPFAFRTIIG